MISHPIQDNNESSNQELQEHLEEIMSASGSTPHDTPQVNVGTAVLLQPEDLQRLINSVVTYANEQRSISPTRCVILHSETVSTHMRSNTREVPNYGYLTCAS